MDLFFSLLRNGARLYSLRHDVEQGGNVHILAVADRMGECPDVLQSVEWGFLDAVKFLFPDWERAPALIDDVVAEPFDCDCELGRHSATSARIRMPSDIASNCRGSWEAAMNSLHQSAHINSLTVERSSWSRRCVAAAVLIMTDL